MKLTRRRRGQVVVNTDVPKTNKERKWTRAVHSSFVKLLLLLTAVLFIWAVAQSPNSYEYYRQQLIEEGNRRLPGGKGRVEPSAWTSTNPFFIGVFDWLQPLEYQNTRGEKGQYCTVNSNLRDIEDKEDDHGQNEDSAAYESSDEEWQPREEDDEEKDTIAETMAPFKRRNASGSEPPFEFPCPLSKVRVAYSAVYYDPNPPKYGWKPWIEERDKLEETDRTKVWYSCDQKKKKKIVFSLGMNPKVARGQIETSRHFYSRMKYIEGAARLRDSSSSISAPPDLFLIVMDSTSRASFHRSFPSIVERLRQSEDVDVFEMFRYSSLGWGTKPNTNILMRGCAVEDYPEIDSNVDGACNETHVPLHLWYAAAGYVLLGNYTYNPDALWHYGQLYSVEMEGWKIRDYHRSELDAYIDMALEHKKYYTQHAPDAPQYFAIHVEDNHGYVNDGLRGQANSLHRLLDAMDFVNRNVIVLLMADHGKYFGKRAGTPLGSVEASNPVLLAITSRGVLTNAQKKQWQDNQQSLSNHWDMHATLKGLPLQYGTGWPQVKEYCYLEGKRGAAFCQPHVYDTTQYDRDDLDRSGCLLPWQKNMILSSLPRNRTCSDVKSIEQFCFCGSITSPSEDWTDKRKQLVVRRSIKQLNKWTGNGKFDCIRLHAKDFAISDILSYQHGPLYGHHLLSLKSNSTNASYLVEVDETMNVIYMKNKYGTFAPKIMRQDFFSKEPCLKTWTDGRMPVFRSNETAARQLTVAKKLNLRWCSCKATI